MRLGNYAFDTPIDFSDGVINILVLENPGQMVRLINDLKVQTNGGVGDFVLTDNGVSISMSNVILVHDPLFFEINTKKLINGLHESLKNEAMGLDLYMETNDLMSKINSYLDKLSLTQQCTLAWDEVVLVSRIIKMADFRFDEERNLIEKICGMMELNKLYAKADLFIFVNLKSFLMPMELELLYRESSYRKMPMLLIESHQGEKMSNETYKIIDFDLCELNIR